MMENLILDLHDKYNCVAHAGFPQDSVPTKGIAGVVCKDDSHQGSFKKEAGIGRRGALTHWMPLGSNLKKVCSQLWVIAWLHHQRTKGGCHV